MAIYYDEDGNELDNPDLTDKNLEMRDGRLTVVEPDGTAREAAVKLASLKASLTATDGDVLAALEGVLSSTSLKELLAALSEARKSLADALEERAKLREEIKEMEG